MGVQISSDQQLQKEVVSGAAGSSMDCGTSMCGRLVRDLIAWVEKSRSAITDV